MLPNETDVTPSSSSTSSTPPQSQPPQQDFGPTGDPGLPIPDSYGMDRVVLMPQDPQHVFVYWELTGNGLNEARSLLGEDGSPVLIIHSPSGSEQRLLDLNSGNYYLNAAPESTYRVEIALRGSDGRLAIIVGSNEVLTPRSGVSQSTDQEWMAVDETLDELMGRAGLAAESAMSSAERFRRAQLTHRRWAESEVSPFSSVHLRVPAPGEEIDTNEILSSLNLSSWSLSSWSLSSASLSSTSLSSFNLYNGNGSHN